MVIKIDDLRLTESLVAAINSGGYYDVYSVNNGSMEEPVKPGEISPLALARRVLDVNSVMHCVYDGELIVDAEWDDLIIDDVLRPAGIDATAGTIYSNK